jgi:glycosyltransferase involved in cell wall biosynthesis
MKKVIFFTQNRWAFGSIHHGLCKELYKYDIYANVLDWTVSYSEEEFKCLNSVYDIFVTNPEAVESLHRIHKVPLNKIITIAHAQWDILLAKQHATFDFYPELRGFGVISNILKEKCNEWQISRVPDIVELGIHFDMFYEKPSQNLNVIGYGGANETHNFFGTEIKRPTLIDKILNGLNNVQLKRHSFYNHLCMPGYYKEIDCIIMSSIEEAGGLPMMEGAAAGRLPIGTPVGYFKENALKGGGILVPLNEDDFVSTTIQTILHYKNSSSEYIDKCLEVQAYARDNYDWSKKVYNWVKLLNS